MELSDKSLTYLLGLQLMFNRGTASVVPALCGFVAGAIAKNSNLPFKCMRVPSVVSSFFAVSIYNRHRLTGFVEVVVLDHITPGLND
jgi:hypothetical protein